MAARLPERNTQGICSREAPCLASTSTNTPTGKGDPEYEPPDSVPLDPIYDRFDDVDLLAMSVTTLHDDLHTIVFLRERLFPSLRRETDQETLDLLDSMRNAWSEVQTQLIRREVVPLIQNLDRQTVGEFGLGGAQLELKLRAWQRSRRQLLIAFADSADADPGPEALPPPILPGQAPNIFRRLVAKRPRWLKRGLRHLKKTLASADIVLGSLAKALPGIDILEEFKEVVEGLAGDKADELPDAPS